MAESPQKSNHTDSNRKILSIALVVCLVCSLIVATTAVVLKPIQTANQTEARQRILVELAGLSGSTEAAYRQFDVDMVELDSGKTRPDLGAENFDLKQALKKEDWSVPLTRSDDPANIRRKPKYLPAYRLNDKDGQLQTLILPIFGYGLWSTLYGYIALEGDLRTVKGIRFYEHAETPGLGGEVDNPSWLANWHGKVLFDENWQVRIELVKGNLGDEVPDRQFKVDGLSGATMTTRGINELLQFWLGDAGFGPYLLRLRHQQNKEE